MLRLRRLTGLVVDSFFPQQCVSCGKKGSFICTTCFGKLVRLLPPFCPKCGHPQMSGIVCPACRKEPSKIDGIRSVFRLDDVMRQAIHQLKYRNLRAIAPYLARLLADYLEANPVPGEILIPVPLHPQRLRERGYNQSSLLARELSKQIGLPLKESWLIRIKHAQPQARAANVEERRQNVADAFLCTNDSAGGKRFILVDDVCTSGATLKACAAALKDKGASSVWGLTVAREI